MLSLMTCWSVKETAKGAWKQSWSDRHLFDLREEFILMLMIQGVRVGDVVQGFLGLEGWEHNLVLRLSKAVK